MHEEIFPDWSCTKPLSCDMIWLRRKYSRCFAYWFVYIYKFIWFSEVWKRSSDLFYV